MKKLDPVHFKDWKHVGIEADPNFDPDHNMRVIEKTIKDAERMQRQKMREFQEDLGERTEALSKYLTSIEQGGAESDVTKYFGKKYKAYLAGKAAIKRMQDGLTSIGEDGKVIRRPGEMI